QGAPAWWFQTAPRQGEAAPPERLSEDALLLRAPWPGPSYQWHLPAQFDSPEGFGFERRIAAALRDAIAAWLPG
ncbi:hypothetical protein, partial [Paracraurococcus ruber]